MTENWKYTVMLKGNPPVILATNMSVTDDTDTINVEVAESATTVTVKQEDILGIVADTSETYQDLVYGFMADVIKENDIRVYAPTN